MRGGWWTRLLIVGIVITVGIGLAVGVLAGNRASPTPGLLPTPDPGQAVHCTSVERRADSCQQGGLDVRPPVVGQACSLAAGPGVWRAAGRSGDDRVCGHSS